MHVYTQTVHVFYLEGSNLFSLFAEYYLLYCTSSIMIDDLPFCFQLMDINESPVFVLLNPSINHAQKDLPVTIFESGM